jgi:hypothetical protein
MTNKQTDATDTNADVFKNAGVGVGDVVNLAAYSPSY